jgi:hypothetical protein
MFLSDRKKDLPLWSCFKVYAHLYMHVASTVFSNFGEFIDTGMNVFPKVHEADFDRI